MPSYGGDLGALGVSFAVALLWLRLCDTLAARGVMEVKLSRKVIHIGTGPLFVLCWPLFSEAPEARYLAALVPGVITVQFALVGLGVLRDPEAVAAMTRTGNPRELLGGPMLYGLVHAALAMTFWRDSPAGIVGLMLLCGGDGFADVVGRRLGRTRIPWNAAKSVEGSVGMFAFGYLFSLGMVALYEERGWFGAVTLRSPAAPLLIVAGVVRLNEPNLVKRHASAFVWKTARAAELGPEVAACRELGRCGTLRAMCADASCRDAVAPSVASSPTAWEAASTKWRLRALRYRISLSG